MSMMNMMNCRPPIVLAVLLTLPAGTTSAQVRPGLPERFTANAINMSLIGSSVPTPIDITITKWTTAAEQERYLSILRGKGNDVFAETLRKAPSVGTVRTPTSLAYDFRYAVQGRTKDNLRQIILLTDRPMEFAELSNRYNSVDYPFAAIELLVDDSGHGKGSFWIAAKLTMLDDLLIMDNYADRPLDLTDVHRKATK